MKIIADKEGKDAIEAICDIARKVVILPNLKEIVKVLESMEEIKEKKEPDVE